MMDWDSHRYLECFFAVPMMGAVLHTVNVRISPDQILYTINHAADDVILVNAEFLPILEAIHDKIRPGVKFVLINDGAGRAAVEARVRRRIRGRCSPRASPSFAFPDLAEDTRATTFYTTGTTGLPKGVYYSHRQLVLHTLGVARRSPARRMRRSRSGRVHAGDADVPRARVGPSLCRHDARREAGVSRAATCPTCCSGSSPASA